LKPSACSVNGESGLDNYVRLFGDQKFWSSIWVTVLYVLYNIPVQTVVGLLIAVLLKRLTGSVAIRSIMLAPFLISNVIAAMIGLVLVTLVQMRVLRSGESDLG
jgi:multiple sugar transport system permease protein